MRKTAIATLLSAAGLTLAGALVGLDAHATVVEFAPRLMPLQVDAGGGEPAMAFSKSATRMRPPSPPRWPRCPARR